MRRLGDALAACFWAELLVPVGLGALLALLALWGWAALLDVWRHEA